MNKLIAFAKKSGPTFIVAVIAALFVVRMNNTQPVVRKITKSV
jgi:hypothetical protein